MTTHKHVVNAGVRRGAPSGLSLKERRSQELLRQRRMRHAKIVHGLGWRVTFEGFDQLARDLDEGAVDRLLERLANLNPEILTALGANDLPVTPIRVVRR
jgi:hypothetical protein